MHFETNYPNNNYMIHVGADILASELDKLTSQYSSVFYLVDGAVYDLHKHGLLAHINAPVILPKGEAAKEFSVYIDTIESLLEARIKRGSLIVAIGGGALGDVAGFVAATVLRGVDYVHVPTTILAHDSAVGGKTAINARHGKNLIGSFHRPKGVIMETGFFNTLPYDEVLSGYGEIFKHAMLNDASGVNLLVERFHDGLDAGAMEDVILMGIKTKLRYVTEDEFEAGSRRYLNLGHTLGHAVERVHNIPHGHAVLLGLLFMMHVSNHLYKADFNLHTYIRHFTAIGIDLAVIQKTDFNALIPLLLQDKKNTEHEKITFVLMKDFGAPTVERLSLSDVRQHFITFSETLNKDA